MYQQNFSGPKNISSLSSFSINNYSRAIPKKNIDINKQISGSINYKNIGILRSLINLEGKILSRRITSLQTKNQKQTAKSIKRSRILGLLPFVHKVAPAQRKLRKKIIRYKSRGFTHSRRPTRRA